jgi:hypothetical protein
MSNIDNFLRHLANHHQEKQQELQNQQSSLNSANVSHQINSNEDNIDTYISQLETDNKENKSSSLETDNLLEEIENNHQSQKISQNNTSPELFSEIEQKFSQRKKQANISPEDSSIIDNSLEQMVRHSQRKIKNSQEKKTVDNLADIRQEELNKQKQIKLLTRKAEAWLKKLDPNSEEGFWFEQFAFSYPSKLEAAIDYLKALENNH